MIKIICIAIALLTSNGAYADCKNNTVRHLINNEVHRLIGGDKYAEGGASLDNYFPIKFDNGNKEGCIVYIGIEGWGQSNAHSEYMSFVELNHGKAKLQNTIEMGQSPSGEYRHIDYDVTPKVEKNILSIGVLLYSKTEGACCPSIPSIAKFKFDGKHIIELEPLKR